MIKFIIRNDDVAYDTTIEEIRRFCEICDKFGIKIIQGIIPIGEARKIKTARMNNDQIRSASNRLFSENHEVVDFLKSRSDLIGIHGLWHTHKPNEEEVKNAKFILQGLGFNPTYFVPPFNEGKYGEEFAGLKVSNLSQENGERLEAFLDEGAPSAPVVYLHSWRFDGSWFTFDALEKCLTRISNLTDNK